MENSSDELSVDKLSIDSLAPEKPGTETILKDRQTDVLKKLREIQKRYPYKVRRRKAYRLELEALARNNPGISFPGSENIRLETTEEEKQHWLLREALRETFRLKLKKVCKGDKLPNAAARVLTALDRLNQAGVKTISETSGLGKKTTGRILRDFISMGLAEPIHIGQSYFYVLKNEGKKLLIRKQ